MLSRGFTGRRLTDWTWTKTVFLCGISAILVLGLIAAFIFREGWPALREIGLFHMLMGTVWKPNDGQFGILPFIITSFYVTLLALIMAVPLGLACAVFLTEVAPHRVRLLFRPAIELLVGIPSVVYGMVGLLLLVPQISKIGGSGDSLLAASIVLTIMVLPTIISISADSIQAVPGTYKEGLLALGATRWQTVWRVTLPTARSGILAGIILGMGRAIGETMAMIMVIGNSLTLPVSPLDSGRTLTGSLALEIKYASGLHWHALFAVGTVLFVLILFLNSFALLIRRRQYH